MKKKPLNLTEKGDIMSSVNKVIIIGNLGKDPEVRAFQNGDKVANLTIATSETWKDKATGERKERTEVYLEGQLETRKWTDPQGQERYTTEVVLRPYNSTLVMLDSKGGGAAPPAQRATTQPAYVGPDDDDIPF